MIFFEIYGEQKTLTQWDLGRRMQVNVPCQQLHFAHEGAQEAVVCPVQDTDGVRTARIPDELLQESGTLWVYAYVKEKEGYTRQIASFFVKERPQPAGYIYTPTEMVRLEDVVERMDTLERTGGAYYLPSVEQTETDTMTMHFEASNEKLPQVEDQTIYLAVGPKGPQGDPGIYTLKEGETLADAPSWAQVVLDPDEISPELEMVATFEDGTTATYTIFGEVVTA